jgi:hypothetical protein
MGSPAERTGGYFFGDLEARAAGIVTWVIASAVTRPATSSFGRGENRDFAALWLVVDGVSMGIYAIGVGSGTGSNDDSMRSGPRRHHLLANLAPVAHPFLIFSWVHG